MSQTKTPRRTQAERTRASREKIIHSAMESFAQKGFRGAKMADIAQAAGLTGPGLLHHFPSKTHLLMEVLKERDRIHKEQTDETLQKNNNDILEVAAELVEQNQATPGIIQLFNLLVAESISPEHPAHGYFTKRYHNGREAWVQIIAQGQAQGDIRSDISADDLGVLLLAMMDGLQVQWLMEPEKIEMARIFRVFVNLLKNRR
ncbi:MAG: TetR/AcrR family transcriptional regulator [Anaerolineales bacterium]|nr:TetR/AcrR family transcriptional regulator [Anaerolineales bacterium]